MLATSPPALATKHNGGAIMDYTDLRHSPSVCNVLGCDGLIRSARSTLCEKHYYRLRRNGHLSLKPKHDPPRLVDHSNGYKLLYAPDHPISTKGQPVRVYEHRAVYYEKHGDGPFRCHWCRLEVTWSTMHVDHLDDDKTNNEPTNLVASCPVCNQRRGSEAETQSP